MADWKNIIGTVAPAIATALGGPLAGLGVTAVGKALGLGDGASEEEVAAAVGKASPEQLVNLKKANLEFQARLKELDVDLERIAMTDRASARKREASTGDSWTPRLLAVLVIGLFGACVWWAFTGDVAATIFWQTTLMAGGKKGADFVANRMRRRAESTGDAGTDETPSADMPPTSSPIDDSAQEREFREASGISGLQWDAPPAPMDEAAWNREAAARGWRHFRTDVPSTDQTGPGPMPMGGRPEDAPKEFLSDADMAETDEFVRQYEAREQAQTDASMLSEYGIPKARRFTPLQLKIRLICWLCLRTPFSARTRRQISCTRIPRLPWLKVCGSAPE